MNKPLREKGTPLPGEFLNRPEIRAQIKDAKDRAARGQTRPGKTADELLSSFKESQDKALGVPVKSQEQIDAGTEARRSHGQVFVAGHECFCGAGTKFRLRPIGLFLEDAFTVECRNGHKATICFVPENLP